MQRVPHSEAAANIHFLIWPLRNSVHYQIRGIAFFYENDWDQVYHWRWILKCRATQPYQNNSQVGPSPEYNPNLKLHTADNQYQTRKLWAATWPNQQSECASSEDSDHPGHPHEETLGPLSARRRLWLDWADAQADLGLRLAHTHFLGFVMSWLNYKKKTTLKM